MQKSLLKDESEISLLRRAYVARWLREIADKIEKDGVVDFGKDENLIKFANEIPNRLLRFADVKARRKLFEIRKMEAKNQANIVISTSYHGKDKGINKIKKEVESLIDKRFEKPGEDSVMVYSCPSNPSSGSYSGWSTQIDKTFLYFKNDGKYFKIGFKRIRTNNKGKMKIKEDRIIYETEIPKL